MLKRNQCQDYFRSRGKEKLQAVVFSEAHPKFPEKQLGHFFQTNVFLLAVIEAVKPKPD